MSKEKPLITGKSILVVSPQRWGVMHVSKHHYAVELARLGNKVYFLNPPVLDLNTSVEIKPHESIENLNIVSYRLFFPYNLRFHLRWLYDWLMRLQILSVLKAIGVSFDIAWCFDTNLFADLRAFGAEKVIYHLADQVMSEAGVRAASSADLIVSVDQALLAKLKTVNVPKLVVGHGIAEPFALQAEKRLFTDQVEKSDDNSAGKKVQVGYVGNLLISSLDRVTFRQIIEENNQVFFNFWGAYNASGSNIGVCNSPDVTSFIDFLESSKNVILHGGVSPEKLAGEIQPMDLFMLCYDVRNDINDGCNSHKILEYLSTGKVVVSNRMSTYEACDDLIRMCSYDDNSDLSSLLSITISRLSICNSNELQKKRIFKALDNSYSKLIDLVFKNLNRVSG